MKLRIRGDTLRLRLSRGDLATLLADGCVEETIHFGPDRAMRYALRLDAGAEVLAADYGRDRIVVVVPEGEGRAWATGADVGLTATQRVDSDRTLGLLVEKDFQCLAPRPGEETYDGFPNPAGSRESC